LSGAFDLAPRAKSRISGADPFGAQEIAVQRDNPFGLLKAGRRA